MPTVNFYTKAGRMYGVDLHEFQAIVPPAPLPIEIPLWPYFVFVPFDWLSNAQHTSNVTNGGWNMVVSNFDVYAVPHVPVIVFPPAPLEFPTWMLIEALSGTEVLFGQGSVTAGGEDTSIALAGAFGLNVNCSDPFDHLLGATYNPNTVQTFVTGGSLLGAFIGYVVVTAVSVGLQSYVKGRVKASKIAKAVAEEVAEESADAAADAIAAPGQKALEWALKKVPRLGERWPEAIASHVVRLTPLMPFGEWLNGVLNPFDPTGTNQGLVADGASAALSAVGLE